MTDASPAKPARYGSVVLARHGEPALNRKVLLSAQGYRDWWARYELGGLLEGQSPPEGLVEVARRAGFIVASTRLRSLQTARAVVGGKTFVENPLFIEAPLPPPNFPGWLKLSPKVWGFVARFWWWFFNHHAGEENRAQAEARAEEAALMLENLARSGEPVLVVAHGFFNHLVGRALARRGWRLAENQGYKYWSTRRFERD